MAKAKHIVTFACERGCDYCINKYLKVYGERFPSLGEAYKEITAKGIKDLLLTGGEPTLLGKDKLKEITITASAYFDNISMYTADPDVVAGKWDDLEINDVVYTIHGIFSAPVVKTRFPVYAAIVYDPYLHGKHFNFMCRVLYEQGYAGLTILRKWPDGPKPADLLPAFSNFSVYYKDDCSQVGPMLTHDLRWCKIAAPEEVVTSIAV